MPGGVRSGSGSAARGVESPSSCGQEGVGGRAEGPPVLLVYGFQPVLGFQPLAVWKTFAEAWSGRQIAEAATMDLGPTHSLFVLQALDGAHKDVIISNYAHALEPTVRSLRYYALRLSDEILWATAVFGVPQVDIVAHSMGGLVARCYIEAADFGPAAGLVYRDDVRMLVTLATPHHGAELALIPLWIGPITDELRPSSDLVTTLEASEDGPSPRAVSMAGQTCIGCSLSHDQAGCLRECAGDALAWIGSDLVVSMASARLDGAENTACVGMNHVDMHGHPALAQAILGILNGESAPTAVYATDELAAALAPGP